MTIRNAPIHHLETERTFHRIKFLNESIERSSTAGPFLPRQYELGDVAQIECGVAFRVVLNT